MVLLGFLVANSCFAEAKKSAPAVLLVIASQDFFYREYNDPREELEKAGYKVVVASAAKTCRPHEGTGQGNSSGEVQADLSITQAKAEDYAAIVFAGGWGSSMYQYAFEGSYQNGAYNGDRKIKEAANKLINEMLAEKKPVVGICHGVSVLAWARVKGESPLSGKRVAAATVNGPAGRFKIAALNGHSRAHAEANGARLVPSQSIGDPQTAADDVAVDGLIVTAENDQSARECGKVLAKLLSEKK